MAGKRLRVLCFGDSLTAGYASFGTVYHPYAEALQERLVAAFPELQVDVLVEGMPGDMACANPFLLRLKSEMKRPAFDWVIILGGTNDLAMNVGSARIFESLQECYDEVVATGSKVLALTVPECEVKKASISRSRNALNASILAHKEPDYHAFDLHAAIPFHSLDKEAQERYWDDGIHLTPDGYDWMGGHIADELIRIIQHERDPLAARKARRLARRPEDDLALDEEGGDPADISQGYVVVRKRDLEQ